MRWAILGLGAMGSRMAARIVAHGHEVVTWNRTPRTVDGASSAPSPREAAAGADGVLTMLTDVDACRAVWLHPEDGVLTGLRAGALAVDASTVTPAWSEVLAGAVERASGRFVAAPVVGTRPHAERGALTVLAGGADADVAELAGALACLGSFLHVGGHGTALGAKLAINGMFAGQVVLLAEALALLETTGVGRSRGLDLLQQTPVFAPVLQGIAALLRAGDDAPRFPIALVAKDLRYAGAQAELPLFEAVAERYEAARRAGLQDRNLNAVAALYGGSR